MFTYLYAFFNDGIYLVKTKQKLMRKIHYFALFTKIWIKRGMRINFKKEKLFGRHFLISNYGFFADMFRETFLHNNYYIPIRSKKPLILDCGANIGITVLFFKKLYPLSNVCAFEPDPKTFKLLEKNVKQYNGIKLYNAALSDKKGTAKFYTNSTAVGDLGMSLFKRHHLSKTINIKTVKLSEFINQKIDILKLDIEGSELLVLKEIIKSKKIQNVENIIVEYHHKIEGRNSILSEFLLLLELEGFEYQLDTRCVPVASKNQFQDILIYAYRK